MSTKCVFRVTSSGLVEGVILGFNAVVTPMATEDGVEAGSVAILSHFKSLPKRVSFLPLFKKESVYEKELAYLLSEQADI